MLVRSPDEVREMRGELFDIRVDHTGGSRVVSEVSLTDRIVTLVKKKSAMGKVKATGFLVTNQGFILTAYHMVRHYEQEWQRICQDNPPPEDDWDSWLEEYGKSYFIIDKDGNEYALDLTTWYHDERYDVALVKAVMPAKRFQPFRLKDEPIPVDSKMKIIRHHRRSTLVDGEVVESGYDVRLDFGTVNDTFKLNIPTKKGDSGSPVLDEQGFLRGMVSFGDKTTTGCIKIPYLRNIVHAAYHDVIKMQGESPR